MCIFYFTILFYKPAKEWVVGSGDDFREYIEKNTMKKYRINIKEKKIIGSICLSFETLVSVIGSHVVFVCSF